jgi:hypothetical protein
MLRYLHVWVFVSITNRETRSAPEAAVMRPRDLYV